VKKIVFFLITVQLVYATDWYIVTFDFTNDNVDKFNQRCIKDNDADPMNYFDKGYEMTEMGNGDYSGRKDDLSILISPTKKACEIIRNKIITLYNKKKEKAKQEERSYLNNSNTSKRYITSWGTQNYSPSHPTVWQYANMKLDDGSTMNAFARVPAYSSDCSNVSIINRTISGGAAKCSGNTWSVWGCSGRTPAFNGSYSEIVEEIVRLCN